MGEVDAEHVAVRLARHRVVAVGLDRGLAGRDVVVVPDGVGVGVAAGQPDLVALHIRRPRRADVARVRRGLPGGADRRVGSARSLALRGDSRTTERFTLDPQTRQSLPVSKDTWQALACLPVGRERDTHPGNNLF